MTSVSWAWSSRGSVSDALRSRDLSPFQGEGFYRESIHFTTGIRQISSDGIIRVPDGVWLVSIGCRWIFIGQNHNRFDTPGSTEHPAIMEQCSKSAFSPSRHFPHGRKWLTNNH
jgi:hypothetical protein